jgi:hypothetical protein
VRGAGAEGVAQARWPAQGTDDYPRGPLLLPPPDGLPVVLGYPPPLP